jgi:hypothetical protein
MIPHYNLKRSIHVSNDFIVHVIWRERFLSFLKLGFLWHIMLLCGESSLTREPSYQKNQHQNWSIPETSTKCFPAFHMVSFLLDTLCAFNTFPGLSLSWKISEPPYMSISICYGN